MALLGAQLVITLVMISIIQKLGPHYSFGRWILCSTGLIRYLYPSNDELKELANIRKDNIKTKKGTKGQISNESHSTDVFHIPRNIHVQLEATKVNQRDVFHLRYYAEYQWFLDFSIYAAFVYTLTEVYQSWFPIKKELNLSMIWCFLVILFAIKLLLSLTIQYFKGNESIGERSTCVVMGFIYMIISMLILIVDEKTLEFGLENAYTSFNESASKFLKEKGLGSSGPASKIVVKFVIAFWCGIFGALFTFPGLRIAKMHWDLLKYFKESRVKQILLNTSFALPFFLVILWIKPVSREYLTERIYSGMSRPLLSQHSFETTRLILIVVTMCIKLLLMPWYLQAYLDMAYHRVANQRKEAGRITNIEYQKKIAAVFYYLCVVSLQYVTPIIICLYMAFMCKTLGEYSWSGLFEEHLNNGECVDMNTDHIAVDQQLITDAFTHAHFAFEHLKSIFTKEVYRGILGFSTWWCCFVYFATTSLGIIYQSYFTKSTVQ